MLKIFRGPKQEHLVNQSIELLKPWPANVRFRVKIWQLREDGTYLQIGKPLENTVCHMFSNDIVFYPTILKTSNFPKKCPVGTGKYYIKNFMVPMENLPPILIETKGKVKVEILRG